MSVSVAVLITCHNRREITLACLASVFTASAPDIDLSVWLTDDGSSDGTSQAVARLYPEVHILHGDGNLFWAGGMRLAERAASATDPEYLLWLNDDVCLRTSSIATLLADSGLASEQAGVPCIIAGAVSETMHGPVTYGGLTRTSRLRPTNFRLCVPDGAPRPMDTMLGNVVLIPRVVRETLNGIDRRFQHNLADLDYGLRARTAGFGVWLSGTVVGTCPVNKPKLALAADMGPIAAVRATRTFRGFPLREFAVFCRRHCGALWPAYFVSPYLQAFGRGCVWSVGRLLRRRTEQP